jgi:hypothetical protein
VRGVRWWAGLAPPGEGSEKRSPSTRPSSAPVFGFGKRVSPEYVVLVDLCAVSKQEGRTRAGHSAFVMYS